MLSFEQEENIVGKGENAGYQCFLLFPHFFQKSADEDQPTSMYCIFSCLNVAKVARLSDMMTMRYYIGYLTRLNALLRTMTIRIRLHRTCSLILIYTFRGGEIFQAEKELSRSSNDASS